jgi:anti-sigma B factor antagonist
MQSISHTMENGRLVIALRGRIDTNNAAAVEKELLALLTQYPGQVPVLDAAELSYISSAGLRVLLSAHKTMMKQGQMKVTNASEIVKEVFDVTGFCDILNIE